MRKLPINKIFARATLHFRTRVIEGLLLVIPLLLTYVVLQAVIRFTTSIVEPLMLQGKYSIFSKLSEIPLNITALILVVILLYILGIIAHTVLGKRLVNFAQTTVEKIPIVRPIYRIFRQSTDVFSGGAALRTSRVVLLEYPRIGILSLGLVTGHYTNTDGEELLTIYIPTIPNPTSGWLAIVKQDQVTETALTFEDIMKIVISAGVVTDEILNPYKKH